MVHVLLRKYNPKQYSLDCDQVSLKRLVEKIYIFFFALENIFNHCSSQFAA